MRVRIEEVTFVDGPWAGETRRVPLSNNQFVVIMPSSVPWSATSPLTSPSRQVRYFVQEFSDGTFRATVDYDSEAEPEPDAAPDIVGPVVAWRAWDVITDMSAPDTRLRSMAYASAWPTDKPLDARCMRNDMPGDFGDHSAPQETCYCGIYVMDSLDDLLEEQTQMRRALVDDARHRTVVLGEVEVWGRAVRHEKGRRVEHARVRSLLSTPLRNDFGVDVGELAAAYRVPLIIRPDLEQRIDALRVRTRAELVRRSPGGVVQPSGAVGVFQQMGSVLHHHSVTSGYRSAADQTARMQAYIAHRYGLPAAAAGAAAASTPTKKSARVTQAFEQALREVEAAMAETSARLVELARAFDVDPPPARDNPAVPDKPSWARKAQDWMKLRREPKGGV